MNKTILLADDSLTIQKVVELTFADTEFEVISLSNGDDLMNQLDEVAPDLVICDIIMPGKDGYEVCQEIKSDPATLHIPVILLSGTFEPFDRDRALAAGCSDIITKPFEARKLIDTVELLLGGEVVKAETPDDSADADAFDSSAPEDPAIVGLDTPPAPVTLSDQAPDAAETAATAEMQVAEQDDSSLDFTDTGFAEMEAAAVRRNGLVDQAPEEGLDFEFSDERQAFGSVDDDVPTGPSDTQPEIDAPSDIGDAAESTAFSTSDEAPGTETYASDFDARSEDGFAVESAAIIDGETTNESLEIDESETADNDVPEFTFEPDPLTTDETPTQDIASPDPFADETSVEEVVSVRDEFESPAATGWVATPPGPPLSEIPEDSDVDPFAGPDDDVAQSDGAPEVDQVFEADSEPEPASEPEEAAISESQQPDVEVSQTSADTGPVPFDFARSAPQSVAPEPMEEPPSSEESTDADVAEDQAAGLSEEDVDRIARRLLEISSDRIEKIVWEIVPDMAEIVIRQRVRELEAEAEEQSSAPEE
jgi:CheY-like chemotaxis protein